MSLIWWPPERTILKEPRLFQQNNPWTSRMLNDTHRHHQFSNYDKSKHSDLFGQIAGTYPNWWFEIYAPQQHFNTFPTFTKFSVTTNYIFNFLVYSLNGLCSHVFRIFLLLLGLRHVTVAIQYCWLCVHAKLRHKLRLGGSGLGWPPCWVYNAGDLAIPNTFLLINCSYQ